MYYLHYHKLGNTKSQTSDFPISERHILDIDPLLFYSYLSEYEALVSVTGTNPCGLSVQKRIV